MREREREGEREREREGRSKSLLMVYPGSTNSVFRKSIKTNALKLFPTYKFLSLSFSLSL